MNNGTALNEHNHNGLLICPKCLADGKKYIMGSVTEKGELEVLRYESNHRVTIIKGESFTVFCQCGFGTTINNIGRQEVAIQ